MRTIRVASPFESPNHQTFRLMVVRSMMFSTFLLALVVSSKISAEEPPCEHDCHKSTQVNSQPEVILTAKPRKRNHRILEPIAVDVTLKNKTPGDILIIATYNPNKNYNIFVTNKNGKEIERSSYFRQVLVNRFERPVRIGTGEEIKQTVVLNLVYDMLCPGTYRATISITYGQRRNKGKPMIAKSETFEVRVSGAPDLDP